MQPVIKGLAAEGVSTRALRVHPVELPHYRKTAEDATPKVKKTLERIVRYCVKRYAPGQKASFVDKSQVYTVRVSLIRELLKDTVRAGGQQPLCRLLPGGPGEGPGYGTAEGQALIQGTPENMHPALDELHPLRSG